MQHYRDNVSCVLGLICPYAGSARCKCCMSSKAAKALNAPFDILRRSASENSHTSKRLKRGHLIPEVFPWLPSQASKIPEVRSFSLGSEDVILSLAFLGTLIRSTKQVLGSACVYNCLLVPYPAHASSASMT